MARLLQVGGPEWLVRAALEQLGRKVYGEDVERATELVFSLLPNPNPARCCSTWSARSCSAPGTGAPPCCSGGMPCWWPRLHAAVLEAGTIVTPRLLMSERGGSSSAELLAVRCRRT